MIPHVTEQLRTVLDRIEEADAIVIGASNGLSISEGIHIFAEDEAFVRHFGDFRRQHGYRCIIHGCFHPYPCAAQKWAFFSRMHNYFIHARPAAQVMQDLRGLVKHKRHFIITSNIDAHFRLAGFEPEHLFEIEGNCRNLQCASVCHDRLYPGDSLLGEMACTQQDGKVRGNLIPTCPQCGGSMQVHIEVDPQFLRGSQWRASQQAFVDFMLSAQGTKIVFLELGVGARNRLIKAPFLNLVQREPQASYICFNKGAELYIPGEIAAKSIGIDGDIADTLRQLSIMARAASNPACRERAS